MLGEFEEFVFCVKKGPGGGGIENLNPHPYTGVTPRHYVGKRVKCSRISKVPFVGAQSEMLMAYARGWGGEEKDESLVRHFALVCLVCSFVFCC